ncbi:MAG TPA: biotin-dependent carboxyltransferase family protein [Puia sp.]|nr:biotin-dependent carboxyltransferase family protein [Puia sp.]
MSLSIIKAGLLDTIQDTGRTGFGKWGINPGGAMDNFATQVANMLVGNCCSEPVIEMHFPGPQILFEQNVLFAVTGADFNPTLDDEPIPLWHPIVTRKNTVLHFPKLNYGATCYLSIHGGFCMDKWLNSYSTNLKAGAGGREGRPLKKGDELSMKESSIYFAGLLDEKKNLRVLPWQADVRKIYKQPQEIMIIPGNEWETLEKNAQADFLNSEFTIHPSSDRMGYQLKGPVIHLDHKVELLSSAVHFGTIQLVHEGQMIILMADHQTTGGYPRIGHVISAHFPKLAQMRPGDRLRFRMVNMDIGEEMLLAQQQELKILHRACTSRLNELILC